LVGRARTRPGRGERRPAGIPEWFSGKFEGGILEGWDVTKPVRDRAENKRP